jgi:hypothetical protein
VDYPHTLFIEASPLRMPGKVKRSFDGDGIEHLLIASPHFERVNKAPKTYPTIFFFVFYIRDSLTNVVFMKRA